MSRKPRIAVIMDENTSVDGTRYEVMTKAYFVGVHRAGGLPFGIPYLADLVETGDRRVRRFRQRRRSHRLSDRMVRGRRRSRNSRSPSGSTIDRALMQRLPRPRQAGARASATACRCWPASTAAAWSSGCALAPVRHPAARRARRAASGHDQGRHRAGANRRRVGNRREHPSSRSGRGCLGSVVASAFAPDGTIEAIEVPAQRFAIGLQWHPEAFAAADNPGNRTSARSWRRRPAIRLRPSRSPS